MASNFTKSMIHVNNIPWTVNRHKLALYFSQFGYVNEAFVAFDKWSGFHKGYGHIVLKHDSKDLFEREHSLEGKNLVLFMKDKKDNGNHYDNDNNNNNNNSIN